MKKTFATLVASLATMPSTIAPSWSAEGHVNGYAEKNIAERTLPARGVPSDYAVIGDSIAAGDPFVSFASVAGLQSVGYPGRCLTKRCYLWNPLVGDFDIAIDGAPAFGVPGMTPRPKKIILEIGVNDLNTGASAKQVIRGLQLSEEVLKGLGVRTVFTTIVPPGKGFDGDATQKAKRAKVNRWIRTQRKFIDFDRALRGWTGYMLPKYDSGDHLHPNQAGHDRMAAAVSDFIRRQW